MSQMSMNEKIEDLERQISDERQQISADRMDVSIGELVNMYEQNELIIQPEYQRFYRWKNAQKTALIESILLGIPIPPIFVAEDENGIWEIVDGLQRVSTIVSFFGKLRGNVSSGEIDSDFSEEDDEYEDFIANKNKWVLEQGDLLKSLEGFSVDTMPQKFILNIKRSVCRVEILRGKSRVTLKYELFKRLNSNGTKLTAQEIRNAIYRGVNSSVNSLVENLSKNELFKKLTELSKQKKKELYDQEMVLRFLAFYDRETVINSNTAKILDNFMERSVRNDDFDLTSYENIFTHTICLINSINDPLVFKNAQNAFVPAYFEAIMVGVARNIECYDANKNLLIAKIEELKTSEEFKKYMGSASNSKNRIASRLEIALKIFSVSREGDLCE